MGILGSSIQLGHAEALSHCHAQHGKVLDLFLSGVTTPENIAACIRVAEALGCNHIYADHAAHDSYIDNKSKIQRMSRCKTFDVRIANHFDLLSSYHGKPFCLEITNSSQSIFDINPVADDKIMIIIGNEINGIADDILSLDIEHIHIPMCGSNSSMNVAVSVAIAAYTLLFGAKD